MDSVIYIAIPIFVVAFIFLILKCCLIHRRVSQRREERANLIQPQQAARPTLVQNLTRQQQAARPTARAVAVRTVTCPEGIAQQTCYAITQPGCPPRTVTRTVLVGNADGRPLDPNLLPTYDQAVTGQDHSFKVTDGRSPFPPPTAPPQGGPQPSAPPPLMAPPRSNLEAGVRGSASFPPPPPYVEQPGRFEVPLEANERTRLLS